MNSHRRERFLNLIGLCLLVGCFLISLGRIAGRVFGGRAADDHLTIRFAHWQLESGIREAFNALAAEYMRLHPGVRVEQMPIPESVYTNWVRTQLIGGTGPELMEVNGKGITNEILANYFEPVTPFLTQPNPYNAGTKLAATPWRNTFIDNLVPSYNQELLQYYMIPNTLTTVRMFYNRPLWREIFGAENLPRTYEELVACCQRTADHRTRAGETILPLAGSQSNAPYLVQRLFSSQTQRLFYSLAPAGQLYPTNEQLALTYLQGRWSFNTPAVADGLEIARGIGRFLPGGFLQLRREDALFIFSQGRALMTVSGSWDAPSIRSQAPFEIGVFDVPVPAVDDPRYGRNTVGVVSEAGVGTGLSLAMTRQTSRQKQAAVLDFLHFLSSQGSNRRFSADSGWLPAVVGVEPSSELRPFLPKLEGNPAGFNMGVAQGDAGGGFGSETTRTVEASMYRLFDPNGGAAAYANEMAGQLRPAIVADFRTIHRDQLEVIARQDTTLAAYAALSAAAIGKSAPSAAGHGMSAADLAQKISELDELQTREEISAAERRWQLGQLGIPVER